MLTGNMHLINMQAVYNQSIHVWGLRVLIQDLWHIWSQWYEEVGSL